MSIALALIAVALAFVSYSFYIRDIFAGRTKPHAFTWGIWSLLAGFIFTHQYTYGAGPGAWPTAIVAVAGALICLLALRFGERKITTLDWLSLVAAFAVGGLWLASPDPELSVILASIVFMLGFVPTIRKSLHGNPQETTLTYALNSLKFLLALLALQSISLTTALYPFILCVTNAAFVAFLLSRRAPRKQQRRKYVQNSSRKRFA